jgi:hypothetical protein
MPGGPAIVYPLSPHAMTMDDPLESADKAALNALYERAYATFDNGDLHQASALFGELATHRPNVA